MKLTYRGINYEQEATTLEYSEGEIGGHYRGQDWHYHYPKHIPQLLPKLHRQYRGVSYSTRSMPFSQKPVTESNNIEGACPVSLKKSQKVNFDRISQVHLDNMRRSLERRLAVAKSKGNEELIKMLEQESKQLTLQN